MERIFPDLYRFTEIHQKLYDRFGAKLCYRNSSRSVRLDEELARGVRNGRRGVDMSTALVGWLTLVSAPAPTPAE